MLSDSTCSGAINGVGYIYKSPVWPCANRRRVVWQSELSTLPLPLSSRHDDCRFRACWGSDFTLEREEFYGAGDTWTVVMAFLLYLLVGRRSSEQGMPFGAARSDLQKWAPVLPPAAAQTYSLTPKGEIGDVRGAPCRGQMQAWVVANSNVLDSVPAASAHSAPTYPRSQVPIPDRGAKGRRVSSVLNTLWGSMRRFGAGFHRNPLFVRGL